MLELGGRQARLVVLAIVARWPFVGVTRLSAPNQLPFWAAHEIHPTHATSFTR
jgi:hypothetical protein